MATRTVIKAHGDFQIMDSARAPQFMPRGGAKGTKNPINLALLDLRPTQVIVIAKPKLESTRSNLFTFARAKNLAIQTWLADNPSGEGKVLCVRLKGDR